MVSHSLGVFTEDQLTGALTAARAAFGSDSGYAAAMARAAVGLAAREHAASLRVHLSRSVTAATSACAALRLSGEQFTCTVTGACGTGACRFAAGPLSAVTGPAPPGRIPRPAAHVHAGQGFGTGPALAAFAAAVPFAVGVRLSSADDARALDLPAR